MKRVLPVLLLIPFLYNSLGYYFIFQAQKYQVKKEVKRKLINRVPENELTVLSFDPALFWKFPLLHLSWFKISTHDPFIY